MERSPEQIEYWYVEDPNKYDTKSPDEVMFDQSHDQINLQMIEIEDGTCSGTSEENSGKQNESWGRPGRKAAVPDEALDEKALNRRNRRRMRNREAAQRQRDRRVSQLNQLQDNNQSLLDENEKLKNDMKNMDEKYKRALFKIQSMQKLMSNCACKGVSATDPTPLEILNGDRNPIKQSRKRSSIELPIVKMTLKPTTQQISITPKKYNLKGQSEVKLTPKLVTTVAGNNLTPEKTIKKYVQYLKTGPFEAMPKLPPQPQLEPPMKKPKLTNPDLDFQAVFADVFLNKPAQQTGIDITKTANASEGAISNHSSVHKFC